MHIALNQRLSKFNVANELAACKTLAENEIWQLDIKIFNLVSYGTEKLQEFVKELTRQTNYTVSSLFLISIMEGARDWATIESNFKGLAIVKEQCAQALKVAEDTLSLEKKADIITDTINHINGRTTDTSKHEPKQNSLTVLLRNIQNVPQNGKISLGDCIPLTVLTHLIMSDLGIENVMRRALTFKYKSSEGIEIIEFGSHFYSEVHTKYGSFFYENTSSTLNDPVQNNLIISAARYNGGLNHQINIWDAVAEYRAGALRSVLDDESLFLSELQELKKLSPNNVFVLLGLSFEAENFIYKNSTDVSKLEELKKACMIVIDVRRKLIELYTSSKDNPDIQEKIKTSNEILNKHYLIWKMFLGV